jgi:outer membrane protein TolC
MSNAIKCLLFIIIIFSSTKAWSQENTIITAYTLEEIIDFARQHSLSSLLAETRKENRYWKWRTHLSDFKPQLSIRGRFPDFNREVIEAQQPDGSIRFQPVSNNILDLNLLLLQNIGLTGGQIFVNTQARRFDDIDRNFTQYSGNPGVLGFIQPLFGFNRLRWNKRIEPLHYEESQKEYQENLENISVMATDLFFNLLLAQISLEIALTNFQNNDTIFKIGEGRYNLGKIAENDLLQLELNVLNSRQDVSQAKLDLETSTLKLKSFIGWTDTERINLVLPKEIPDFDIDEQIAIREARKNRSAAVAFKRQLLQAQADVFQAKREGGLNMDIFGTVGLANRAENIGELYTNPTNQQSLSIGFQIPILDWGRQKSVRRTAEANSKLVEYSVAQDEVNFDQEVYTQVKQFKMLRDQLLITSKSDYISLNRYEIARNRYLIGKISITDLTIALQDKDNAKRSYIASLRNFWTAYYRVRYLTLYDFENDRAISSLE